MSVSIISEEVFHLAVGQRDLGMFRRRELLELRVALDMALLDPEQQMNPEVIIRYVCEAFGLTREEIMSNRRPDRIVFPRQVAMWLIRCKCGLSLDSIGELFGGKDHSTVMWACSTVKERRVTNEKKARIIGAIERALELQCSSHAPAGELGSTLAATPGTALGESVATTAAASASVAP